METILKGLRKDLGVGGAGLTPSGDPNGLLAYLTQLGSTFGPPVADETALAAVLAKDRADKQLVKVGVDIWYRDDSSAATASPGTVVTSTDSATGRWIKLTGTVRKKTIPLPLTIALVAASGAPLAVFADGASATPGVQLTDSKSASVRWNNHATPGAIALNVPMPNDLDDAAAVTFHALVSKTGATAGDATALTVGAFEHTVGALHDADADFGGDTTAVSGTATAKTVSEVTLALTAANVHAVPSSMALTIKPKAGTLGTDDLVLHSAWLEYTSKPVA